MNRKQRRAHARHTRSSNARSGRSQSQRVPLGSGVPLRNRGLEATLSASADHDDHAEFQAMVQATLEAPHPAAFLHRVSSMIAVATDDHLGVESLSVLINRVGDDDSLVGYSLLVGLSALAPTADDRAHAQRLVETRLLPAANWIPAWLHGLTQARALTAMEYGDLWWDSSFQAIELDIAGHSFSVFMDVDHVAGYAASYANFADESIAGFFETFPEVLVEPGTTSRYLSLSDAGRRYACALHGAEGDAPSLHADAKFRHVKWLAEWAGRLAREAGPSLPIDFVSASTASSLFDPDEVRPSADGVVQNFLASEHGQRAQEQGVAGGLEQLIAYGSGHGHRQLLAWGPVRVADFLLRHIPETVWSDAHDLRGMLDLLRHWIRYVNESCQMPTPMGTESIDRIAECEPIYTAIIESRARSLADFTDDLVARRQ